MSATLRDTSHLRRAGLKGPRAERWLREQGVDAPALPNTWRFIGDSNDIIARLGSSEFFLEQAASAQLVEQIASQLAAPIEGVYPVLREDRGFVLSGAEAEDVLAQVCNIDFKGLSRARRPVVMTMMIGVAVLVIPQDAIAIEGSVAHEANAGYRIWCDPSYSDYVWSSLQDVMQGTNVGESE